MTFVDHIIENRWVMRVFAVVCVGIIAVSAFYAIRAADNAGDTRELQRAQQASAARTECAREVNAERNLAVDGVTIAKARVDQLFVAAVLLPPGEGAAVREPDSPLSVANRELEQAIADLEALPPTDREVERRCPG